MVIFIFMSISIYVCIYVHMYRYVCIYMYLYIYIYIYRLTLVRIHVNVHAHVHSHPCLRSFMHTSSHTSYAHLGSTLIWQHGTALRDFGTTLLALVIFVIRMTFCAGSYFVCFWRVMFRSAFGLKCCLRCKIS